LWPFRTKIPPKDPKKGLRKLKQRVSDLESDLRRVRADGVDTQERLAAAIGRWSARTKADKKREVLEDVPEATDEMINRAIIEGTYNPDGN